MWVSNNFLSIASCAFFQLTVGYRQHAIIIIDDGENYVVKHE
jgi:hypothetical protein